GGRSGGGWGRGEGGGGGVVGGGREVATTQTFQEQPKLVGTGAVGSANQGMSVTLSADGNTAIVGGPGANNADRDRPPSVGPAGAAWVFTRSVKLSWLAPRANMEEACGPKVHPSPCPHARAVADELAQVRSAIGLFVLGCHGTRLARSNVSIISSMSLSPQPSASIVRLLSE